jgi:hypothetical protein
MIKREAKARNEAWRTAVSESRVVRCTDHDGHMSFTAYPTVEAAQAGLKIAKASGAFVAVSVVASSLALR